MGGLSSPTRHRSLIRQNPFYDAIPNQTRESGGRRLLKWMTADQVVRTSMRFLEKGKVVCIPGFGYKILRWVSMYVPRGLYYRLFGGSR